MVYKQFVINLDRARRPIPKLEDVKAETESIFPGVIVTQWGDNTEEFVGGLLLSDDEDSENTERNSGKKWICVTHRSDKPALRKAQDFIIANFEPEWISKEPISNVCACILELQNRFWLHSLQRLHSVKIRITRSAADGPATEIAGEYEKAQLAQEDLGALSAAHSNTENDPAARRDFLVCVTQSGCLQWPDYSGYPASLLKVLTHIHNRSNPPPIAEISDSSSPEIIDVQDGESLEIQGAGPSVPPNTEHDESIIAVSSTSSLRDGSPEQPTTSNGTHNRDYDLSEYAGEGRKPGTLLRPVIVDASNVGFSYGKRDQLDVKGILLTLKYFVDLGHKCVAVMPLNFSLKYHKPRHDKTITDRALLDEMEELDLLVFSPVRVVPRISGRQMQTTAAYDDLVILKRAEETGGVVVSGDKFRDIVRTHEEFSEIIRTRVILPIWFKEDLSFAPDGPLGRHGESHATTMKVNMDERAEKNGFIEALDQQLTKEAQRQQQRELARLLSLCTRSTETDRPRKRSRSSSPTREAAIRPRSAGPVEENNATGIAQAYHNQDPANLRGADLKEKILDMGFGADVVNALFRSRPDTDLDEALSALTTG